MLYTPLLPEAASGTLEPRHVVVPLREMCPHAELVLGSITGHDRDGKSVAVESLAGPIEIGYERLVIALGATTRTLPVPGLAEHGVGFKDLADAIALRNHVLLQLERASIHPDDPAELGFVFVGAGYAGVEALAELHDMAHAALRSYPALRKVPQRWVLVDAAPKILPEIPRKLGEYASRRLQRRGIEIHVGTTLESYDGREAVLANGMRIPARTLVWTAGVRASPLAPGARRPARRARPRPPRRDAARRRVRLHLGTRRLRCREEHEDAGRRRPTHLPARSPPGAPAREEPDRRAQAVRLPHAWPGRDAGTFQRDRRDPRACISGASPDGSSRGRITCTSSHSSRGSFESWSTGPSRCSSAATSSSSRCSAIRGSSATTSAATSEQPSATACRRARRPRGHRTATPDRGPRPS